MAKAKAKPKAKTKPKAVAKKAVPTADIGRFMSPLNDRVLVMPIERERVSAGGIIIPDTTPVAGTIRGVIVSAGRGRKNKRGQVFPLALRVGDKVLFPEYTGTEIEVHGQKAYIMHENEVLGTID
jgi:chaperonin GroES